MGHEIAAIDGLQQVAANKALQSRFKLAHPLNLGRKFLGRVSKIALLVKHVRGARQLSADACTYVCSEDFGGQRFLERLCENADVSSAAAVRLLSSSCSKAPLAQC